MRGIPIQGPFFIQLHKQGLKKGAQNRFATGGQICKYFASRSMCCVQKVHMCCLSEAEKSAYRAFSLFTGTPTFKIADGSVSLVFNGFAVVNSYYNPLEAVFRPSIILEGEYYRYKRFTRFEAVAAKQRLLHDGTLCMNVHTHSV
jgi:hypothetical protein